jgi:cell division cycle 14
MLVDGDSLRTVWNTFAGKIDNKLDSYKDSGTRHNSFGLTNYDCLGALQKAVQLKWYDVKRFNSKEYFKLNQLNEGDINWVIPGCILAMSSPSSSLKDGALKPNFFINFFLTHRVKSVVRLNEKMYNHDTFKRSDIEVYNMEYPDGSNPPDEIIVEFI